MGSVPGLGNMGTGLSFPITSMAQYPSGMTQVNDCHQMNGYDLISQSHHHHHSFANSFPNHSFNSHHAAAAAHGMTAFADYGKPAEEYAKAMHSIAGAEGHHASYPTKAAATASAAASSTATNSGGVHAASSAMLDCYKIEQNRAEANNNWNNQSSNYIGSYAAATGGATSAVSAAPTTSGVDYSHQYGINIGHNF